MKNKFVQTILILFFLVGCKSKEEKANELIKQEMFKTLYDFASYEPVETKIDSAFSTIYRDSVIVDLAMNASANLELTNEYLQKSQEAKSTMEIWTGGYSSYSSSRFNDAYEEFTENLKLAQYHLNMTQEYSDSIKKSTEGFLDKFIGWQATHLFRAKTKGGQPDLATYLYIFDPKIEKILYSEDTNDETLKKYKDLIDEAIKGELGN